MALSKQRSCTTGLHGWLLLGLVVLIQMGCQPQPADQEVAQTNPANPIGWSDAEWTQDILSWRSKRVARLMAPDGYLALSGLDFLEPGEWRVGSDSALEVKMPAGPSQWGLLVLTEDQAWFKPVEGEGVVVGYPHPQQESPPLEGAIRLVVSGSGLEPSRIGVGETHFYMAVRKGDWVVRTRDPNSEARQGFVGLDYYPLDRDYQVVGHFEPHPEGTTIPTATVLGELLDEPNPGRVVFQLGGQSLALEAIESESGDQFFFILADRTSGPETYGLGRFLYSDLPSASGEVVLDFNKAYNPPCAFNAFTTCPLPPPENRLDTHIRAGELKYRGKPGQDPDQLP